MDETGHFKVSLSLSFFTFVYSYLLSSPSLIFHFSSSFFFTLQWGAADAKFKVPFGENKEFKLVSLKPGVGQYIAIHVTLTARDFFLA